MAADTVQQIKDKLSILDVVQPYVKLVKAGKHYKGLSPFTKEKTPSFYVNTERNSYYCFSSGQGGDQFTFIEKMEGVDFKGALKILAEKAGVEIVYERTGGADKGKRERLYEALARVEALYRDALSPGGTAHDYALSRGLTEESIRHWSLGYAPDAWRVALEDLTAAGFTLPELVASGIVKEADEKKGTYYDRFRNRLMFPIKDGAGRTVAFTGRALSPDDQAKYLNSPETDLFKKSEILFGMDKAKDAIRTRGFALLVEGQMDLLLLHQIGFTNTIALSGTALTPQHLALIKRYADNLMLALDSDRAGLNASLKNAKAALKAGMRVKAVRMPEGKDPADVANEDPKDFSKRVADAQSIVEFFLSVLVASEPDAHRLLIKAEATVMPLIAAIDSPLEREHFIGLTARTLSTTQDAVREAVRRAGALEQASGPSAFARAAAPQAKPAQASLIERFGTEIRAIAAAYPDTALAKRLESEYARSIGAPFPDDLLSEAHVFAAGIAYGEDPDEHAADELISAFEKASLAERLVAATARLRTAEVARDEAGITAALEECRTLTQSLSALS